MQTYKLTIEYDGTAYAGWQRQPNHPTIQSTIEDAILQISQVRVPTVAAGRTDAGVHALGQVVSFRSESSISPHEWTRALNGVLPNDICVHQTEVVSNSFHARYSARQKTYEYHILNHPIRPVLDRLRCWHIPKLLDLSSLQAAARIFQGQHNFSSFQGSPTDNQNPVCKMNRVNIVANPPIIRLTFQADRFLKQMIRAIVGTLVEVGHGKRSPSEIPTILEAHDRCAAGKTAPPYGLYLLKVDYDEEKERENFGNL
ncbi:tRNA pseudouridine(38-40) synthase TruA [Candidatus Nitronereus thalassa]|uniref:tRNA pseudouridine synthase A n=1 Tax=Candidatus Nitronereus thalassa TaxID=3020898 RepID=A0ABU3K4E4_9BACT|nr:tRNA pseudouridine(38-40) synthase TruA [Candidatus Nitronereus thalassa]MDT7041253.1 tRNA pseudouridine(38-40) synthase TruA [Candidatus Nitronereus thalassa]